MVQSPGFTATSNMALLIGETRLHGCGDDRPMMLKDFLRNDYGLVTRSPAPAARVSPTKPAIVLLRSRSRRAAATTISAIQRVISAVKSFQFERRSGGPREGRSGGGAASGAAVRVKVKDILRWRSFRDLEEEGSTPLDPPFSPDRTVTTSFCTSVSGASSSNFTTGEEDWVDQNDVVLGKKSTLVNLAEEDWPYEESYQQSPVSVLYSPFRPITLANAERAKCVLTARTTDTAENPNFEIGEAEEVAAEQLLARLSRDCALTHIESDLILDFFMDEMVKVEEGCQLLQIARSWIHGEHEEQYEWEVEDNRKAYVQDMEKGVSWSRFGEEDEDEEICRELEGMLMDDLLDDFLEEGGDTKDGEICVLKCRESPCCY